MNTSEVPCFLPSWPIIQLLDRYGNIIDIAYDFLTLNGSPTTLPPTQQAQTDEPIRYGLRPEQTAGMLLPWGNWCQPAINGGVIIRLFLLRKGDWIDIQTQIEGGGHCDDPGTKSTIDVIGFGY